MIKNYWRSRTKREQTVLAIGAALAFLIILWGYGFTPLAKSRDRLQTDIMQAQTDLRFMREAAGTLSPLRTQSQFAGLNRNGKSALSLIDESLSARGLGLAMKQIEPVSAGYVKVSLEQVQFDDLMSWLEELRRAQGIVPDDLKITRVEGVGVVNARLGLLDPIANKN